MTRLIWDKIIKVPHLLGAVMGTILFMVQKTYRVLSFFLVTEIKTMVALVMYSVVLEKTGFLEETITIVINKYMGEETMTLL